MRLSDIERQIGGMSELLDIVTAMRTLAGVRMREAQKALPGVRSYAAAVATAISDTLSLMEEGGGGAAGVPDRMALVLCAAEHGFVGGFMEHLGTAAERALGAADQLLVLGTRGAALSEERGRIPDWSHPMPTRISGVTEAVNSLATEIYRRLAAGAVGRVEVIHARPGQAGGATVERVVLLPLDVAALPESARRDPPLHALPPTVLRERLISEYVFARLAEAAVESIAAENAARFATMESARDRLGRTLEELRQDAGLARQAEITDELLDLMTGASAANATV